MKTINEQEQIREEFEKGFNDNCLAKLRDGTYKDSEMQFGFEFYEQGRFKSMEEIERLKNEIIMIDGAANDEINKLKSKLPDQEELRKAIEAANFIIAWQVINPYPTEQVYLQLKTIKTFLESLKTTNGEG